MLTDADVNAHTEGNTYNKDRLLAYGRSNKLRQGNALKANSFKEPSSITSSTSDAASPLSIKQLLLEVFNIYIYRVYVNQIAAVRGVL
jgi:hypothetical protein